MSDETALAVQSPHLMPAMTLADATSRFQHLISFTRDIMRDGVDFGTVPGTTKPTLLKPGAEKLTTFFGLSVRYQLVESVEDWTGVEHAGEPFFYYWFRCLLNRGDLLIAEADGSCNSWETKYRYRQADRKCPTCQQPTIIKGREEYGGGWLCWAKRGGCGAKFHDGDPKIEGQETGRIPNPNPADIVNTIKKMSQKRALVAATLLAVNASEFFTQDMEDLGHSVVNGDYTVSTPPPADTPPPSSSTRVPAAAPPPRQAPPARAASSGNGGQTNGTSRPYSSVNVRKTVRQLAKWVQADDSHYADALRIDGEPVTEKQVPTVASLLGKAVFRPGLGNGELDKVRYDVMDYLLGCRSTNQLTKKEASALIQWLAKSQDDVADINQYCRAEAASILSTLLVENGQLAMEIE